MKQKRSVRLLSLLLVVIMLVGIAAPVGAVGSDAAVNVTFTKVDNSEVSASLLSGQTKAEAEEPEFADTDIVRVSIFLEKRATIEAGFSAERIASNEQAMSYRANLKELQAEITASIENTIGTELDVAWNLTLAANVISANVPYGQIEAIESVPGVGSVLLETRYEPQVVDKAEIADPNMATSSKQIGSAAAWAAGYTGAGSRIAVIDTGADTNHQSLNAAAFEYSLQVNAEKNGMTVDAYLASLDLLDAEEIEKLSGDLNADTGSEAYVNTKIPFGYNYIDQDLDIDHDNDSQGDHGSHVSGIATANAYLQTEDGFVSALETAMVQGVAPDAQLIAMKVFGKNGGAYDSDYMAAIEDAIVLGCDAANLSLGTVSPGNSRHASEVYQTIMENLSKSGIVVSISAGNSGTWVENAQSGGLLYAEDVSMTTSGAPGSLTNSLAVASVDNDGSTGFYVSVGDITAIYSETGAADGYTNEAFTTIAGEHEYIYIDGIGSADDIAALGSVLEGKIFLCARGSLAFSVKANNAVAAGAAGVLICNNQPGIINMDLSDYTGTKPVAALTQKDALAIRAVSEAVCDESGAVLYYTGTMTVSAGMGASQFESEYYTMSDFSSWGIPGSLQMKPEITAPGGSIYSLNGVDTSGTAYQIMSGTSMAAPQVAGMAAVVAQYVREEELAEKSGLTERQLIQSLLMSTAVPMKASEHSYYPILQQGAGLANVSAAIAADSYITMAEGSSAGAADGKVKVELGDDPDRTGSYTASFTIHNLTAQEKTYELSAEFFVQALTTDGVYDYMDLSTTMIAVNAAWSGEGVNTDGIDLADADVNGDGAVNADDGLAILSYAAGAVRELAQPDKADLDGDGDVDSYDAYLFLKTLNCGMVTVPANGSAAVTVTVTLPESQKAQLEDWYANGTYIQGYLFAESAADAEGVAGTCHSIPVLGFYGSWTDPSMYDVSSWVYYSTGEETRTPYLGMTRANDFKITFEEEPEYYYSFGGNPVVPDEYYMPERNAINSADIISGIGFVSIRNAAASRVVASNLTTGQIIREVDTGVLTSAYYHDAYGMWQNTGAVVDMPFSFATASEGDLLSVEMMLAPEYYVDDAGNVDWDALHDGAIHGISMVVDNTAPVLDEISLNLIENTMTVTASDDRYIAAVGLFNRTGTRELSVTGSKTDIQPGETAEYTFSLDGINGKKFLVQVMDYAMNKATYLLEMQLGEVLPMPEMIGFDMAKVVWAKFDKEFEYSYKTGIPVYADSPCIFYAGTIAEHFVFASTDEGDLYVMPEDDLTDMTHIVRLDTILTDMAYNQADGNIYAVNDKNKLFTLDKLTGVLTEVDTIGVTTNTLACDAEGTFYCNGLGTGAVYSFTLDTMAEPTLLVEDVGIQSQFVQTMEIDPNTGLLYWNSFYKQGGVIPFSYLFEINPATGEFLQRNDFWHEITCLLIPVKASGDNSWTEPTDVVSGISLSRYSLELLRGGSMELIANVHPWTATDRTVTWSSADESIATVDKKGVVTAVSVGTTTITATSNLDPSFSASCTVTVGVLDVTIDGTVMDENGNSMFYSWNMGKNETWTPGNGLETSVGSVTYSTQQDVYYIADAVVDSWAMHKVGTDGKTIETVKNPNGIALWDMAYSDYYTEKRGYECATFIYYYYLLSPKDPMAMDAVGFNLSSVVSYLAGITSLGYEAFEQDGVTYDTEHLIMIDSDATVWDFWIYDNEETGGMGAFYLVTESDLPCEFLGDANMDNLYTSLMVDENGALYVATYTGETSELYVMTYDAEADKYLSAWLGDMGDAVWPATITSVTVNESTGTAAAPSPVNAAHMDAVEISAAELASVKPICRAAVYTVTPEDEAAKLAMEQTEPAEPASNTVIDTYTVTVDVTVPTAATNGVTTVSWNSDALSLYDMTAYGDYTVTVDHGDSITFGYVALDGIEADATVATFVFEIREPMNSTVTVSHGQINNTTGTVEKIEVNLTGEEIEKFDLYGANMKLGNDLGMNFFVKASDVTGENWYAEIVRGTTVTTIALNSSLRDGSYYKLTYPGFAAKEMTDEVVVTIYDAEGNARSNPWTDSIRAYAMRILNRADAGSAQKTLMADMLNYGAAAQTQFGYKADDLANALMTDAQKAFATETVELADQRVKGTNYYGSSLSLKTNIQMNVYFTNVTEDMTATIRYTNHNGENRSFTAAVVLSDGYGKVTVDQMVVSDADCLITVEVSDADGNVVASVTDSVASYASRTLSSQPLNEYLMKFCRSAWQTFH